MCDEDALDGMGQAVGVRQILPVELIPASGKLGLHGARAGCGVASGTRPGWAELMVGLTAMTCLFFFERWDYWEGYGGVRFKNPS